MAKTKQRNKARLRRFGLNVAMIFLLLTLCLQAAVAILFSQQHTVTIPLGFKQKIEQSLSPEGMLLKSEAITVSINGEITILAPKLIGQDRNEPTIRAESLAMRFSLYSIVSGGDLPASLDIYKGRLICPAHLSPSGVREIALERLNASVDFGRTSTIRSLTVHAGTGRFSAHGDFDSSILRSVFQRIEPSSQERSFEQQLYQAASQVLLAREQIEQFDNPNIHLRLAETDDAINAEVLFHAGTLSTPGDVNARLTMGTGFFSIHRNDGFNAPVVFLEFADTYFSNFAETARLNMYAQFPIDQTGLPTLPESVYFEGANILLGKERHWLSHAHGELSLNALPQMGLNVFVSQPSYGWSRIQGELDTQKESASFAATATIIPLNAASIDWVELPPEAAKVHIIDPASVVATVALSDGFNLETITGMVSSSRIAVGDADPHCVRANISYTNNELLARDIWIEHRDWSLEGSYWQNLRTNDYRILLLGSLDPWEIDEWMPSWWENLFNDMEFYGNPPSANIDIIARWGQPEVHEIFGRFEGDNFSYKGVQVRDASMKLLFPPSHLALLDIDGYTNEGRLQGDAHWFYRNMDNGFHRFYTDCRSTIALHDFGAIAGQGMQELLGEMQSDVPPDISIKGNLYGPDSTRNNQAYLDVRATAASDFRWRGYWLDRASVDFNVRPGLIDAKHIDVGIGRGSAVGSGQIRLNGDAADIGFDFALNDVRYALLFEALPFFDSIGHYKNIDMGEGDPTRNADLMQQVVDRNPGILRGSIAMNGRVGRPETFNGKGGFNISQAELGELNILGGLSSATGLARFRLDETHGSFSCTSGTLHFPDLELKGPNAQIRGSGNLYLAQDKRLDFKALVNVFGSNEIPVIRDITGILGRLGQTFEVQLQGTVRNPEWKVGFNPFGIFGDKGVVEKPKQSQLPE